MSTTAVRFFSGTGSPEGAITAPPGSEYYQTDGASGSEIFDKVSGTSNTGWRVRSAGTGSLDTNGFLVFGSGSNVPLTSVSLSDFGAKPTGSSSDVTANNAAIANAIAALPTWGGMIRVPAGAGEYGISASPNPGSKMISFVGEGVAPFQGGLTGSGQWHPISAFKWYGSSGANVFANTPLVKMDLYNIGVDCNSLAARGFLLDRWQYSRMDNVVVRNFTTEAIHMTDTGTTANEGSRHNTLINVLAMGGPTLLRLSGNSGHTGNCCHNKFLGLNGHLNGTNHGIIVVDADDNDFYEPWMFGPSVATNGFYGFEFQARGRQNYLYHIQNEVIARTPNDIGTNASANMIYGYDRSNGQAAPTLESGARLIWDEQGNNGRGNYLERLNYGGDRTGQKPSVSMAGSPGAGATITVSGNDTCGLITLTTGTSGTGWMNFFLSYYRPWPSVPRVLLTPANINADALTGVNKFHANEDNSFASQTQFWPGHASTSTLQNNLVYKWYYFASL